MASEKKVLNRNYRESFSDWDDLREKFSNDYSADNSPVPAKEPRYVFAVYDTPPYEGSAEIIYSDDGKKFFMASGSHCSCFGLEGQWQPIEMPLEGIDKILSSDYGELARFRDEVKRWVARASKAEAN